MLKEEKNKNLRNFITKIYKRKDNLFRINLIKKSKKFKFILSLFFVYFIVHGTNISNKVHIAINIDNNFLYPCIVLLTSIFDNRAESTFYIIHILTDNSIKEESMNKINTIKEKFGKNKAEIKFYNLEGDFKGVNTDYFPETAYYRISLPSRLQDVDRVIYIDTDCVNFKDLAEMYNIKFNDTMYISAPLDFFITIEEIYKLGIKPDKYINSGIMLMDLKTMRNDGIETKIRNFALNHYLNFADQTAINAVCHKNIQILPFKYAIFALDSFEKLVKLNSGQPPKYRVNESELNTAFNNPTIVHYFTKLKPWKSDYKNFKRIYWWYYAKMSGFYEEILNHFQFNKNEVEALLKEIPDDGGFLRSNYKKLD